MAVPYFKNQPQPCLHQQMTPPNTYPPPPITHQPLQPPQTYQQQQQQLTCRATHDPDPSYALPAYAATPPPNQPPDPLDWQHLQVQDLRPPDVAPPLTHQFGHHQDQHQPQPTLLYQHRHPPVVNTGFLPPHAQPPDHLEWQQLYYDQNFATSASGQPQPELPLPPYQSERYPPHDHPWSTTTLDPLTLHQSPTTGCTNNTVTDSYTMQECSTWPPIGYELDAQRRTSQFYHDWQSISRPSGPPLPDSVPHPQPAMLPASSPPYTVDSPYVNNIGVSPTVVPNVVVHIPEEPVLIRVKENIVSEQGTSYAEEVVSGELYSLPQIGDFPAIEEEEVHVAKDVDEAQDDTEPMVETPTVIDEAPKKSYAPIAMHLKVTAATLSLFPAYVFVPFIEWKMVKEGVRSLIVGVAPPEFEIIQSVGMDPIITEANLDYTANFTNRLISFKENHKFQMDGIGEWLHDSYAYYQYSTYGFGKGGIVQLFIAGFGTSGVFGSVVGSLAEKQGRKRAGVTYYLMYILSGITKHSPQYAFDPSSENTTIVNKPEHASFLEDMCRDIYEVQK